METLQVRTSIFCVILLAILGWSVRGAAQQTDPSMPAHSGHDMQSMPGMNMATGTPDWLPSPHAGSGTAWEPASVPAHLWMTSHGGWDLMAHGVVFLTYNQQGGPRGAGKAESVNWLMVMEQHKAGKGTLLFRQMFSAESLTAPHPGFPEIFQTGETYHGEPLVDHQHPHNVFAELSAYYSLPLTKRVSWLLYGGPSAQPALGPVAYVHRTSAAELPAAPLSHHLQDSTHTSFGVVTTGLVVDRFKLEVRFSTGASPTNSAGASSWRPWIRGRCEPA
jgi:hypothetical protein